MGGVQWLLEIALVGLLAATLFHALRLERALGVIKRDRAELETLVRSFNDSTKQAESGIEKLRSAADGAGRHIARQIEAAANLKDDLTSLIERGERLADQMDGQVRAGRDMNGPVRRAPVPEPEMADLAGPRVRSQAERDLLRALRVSR
ncbi:MAG: DUF6468 domain-containing protein [Acetobacteraceae bacterium]